MKPIITIIDLEEYKKQIQRQKEVLKFSLVFDDQQKQDIAKCYDDLIAICVSKETSNKLPHDYTII